MNNEQAIAAMRQFAEAVTEVFKGLRKVLAPLAREIRRFGRQLLALAAADKGGRFAAGKWGGNWEPFFNGKAVVIRKSRLRRKLEKVLWLHLQGRLELS